MQRVAFLMGLKPGFEEEYKRRHAEIWPELLDALHKAGAHNYSIFRHGEQLFAYLETPDFEQMVKYLAEDPTNARWQIFMQSMMDTEVDPQTNFPWLLPEMFHMD